MSSAVYLCSESCVPLVSQCPVDYHRVILIRLEKPFLMRGQWGTIFLIRASMERARVKVAVEAHTGLKEWVRALDAVANEGG
jgi:hypothetical protein